MIIITPTPTLAQVTMHMGRGYAPGYKMADAEDGSDLVACIDAQGRSTSTSWPLQ